MGRLGFDSFDAMGGAPDSVGSTASSLLRRLKTHEDDAWGSFLELYGPLLHFWCYLKCNLSQEDAKDVLSESIKAVHGAIDDYKHNSFRGWLWTIVRNKALDHHRGQAQREQATGGTNAALLLAELPEEMPEPTVTDGGRLEINSLLHRALERVQQQVEPKTWQAFWRVVVLEQDTAQVSADLGMTKVSVRVAKSRVLKRLRDELGESPER
jgi:RNA polymerase sigma-70 factor (ECF subfamily)